MYICITVILTYIYKYIYEQDYIHKTVGAKCTMEAGCGFSQCCKSTPERSNPIPTESSMIAYQIPNTYAISGYY